MKQRSTFFWHQRFKVLCWNGISVTLNISLGIVDSTFREKTIYVMQLVKSYETFQCGRKNIIMEIKKKERKKKEKKNTPKSCILIKFFFLCSPACPKQPRTSFPFYIFFHTTISARISVWNPKVLMKQLWLWLPLKSRLLC